jgi:hypothetical protein
MLVASILARDDALHYTTPEGETWRRIRFPLFRVSASRTAWLYASDAGRLMSADGSRVREALRGKGYCSTTLSTQDPGTYGGCTRATIHRIVAYTFLGDPPSPGYTVDHVNRVTEDNRVCNLRWASPEDQLGNREYARYRVTLSDGNVVFDTVTGLAEATGISSRSLLPEMRHVPASGGSVTVGANVLNVEVVKRKRMRAPTRAVSSHYGSHPCNKKGGTRRSDVAFGAFVAGNSVAAVAGEMGLARATVLGYIGQSARTQRRDALERLAARMHLMAPSRRQAVADAVSSLAQQSNGGGDFQAGRYEGIVRTLVPELGDDWDVIQQVLRALRRMLDA